MEKMGNLGFEKNARIGEKNTWFAGFNEEIRDGLVQKQNDILIFWKTKIRRKNIDLMFK
jgi:hypothetical protein